MDLHSKKINIFLTIKWIVLFFLYLVPAQLFGTLCEKAFIQIVKEATDKFAVKGHCCGNVYNTLRELISRGFNIHDLRVIFFDYETRLFKPVHVEQKIRGGEIALLPAPYLTMGQYWHFHFVVLDKNGYVYDSQIAGPPLQIKAYFSHVFPQKDVERPEFYPMDRLKHIYIKITSAKKFLYFAEVTGDGKAVVDIYKSNKLPAITAKEFLDKEFP